MKTNGKTNGKLETGRISSGRADDARTARELLRWVRRVNPKVGRELAAEHAAGILSDHDVIMCIENSAEDFLPDGYRLNCDAIYPPQMQLEDGLDRDIQRRPPIGYAYFVDEDVEEIVEQRLRDRERRRTGVGKSDGERIYRNGAKRQLRIA